LGRKLNNSMSFLEKPDLRRFSYWFCHYFRASDMSLLNALKTGKSL